MNRRLHELEKKLYNNLKDRNQFSSSQFLFHFSSLNRNRKLQRTYCRLKTVGETSLFPNSLLHRSEVAKLADDQFRLLMKLMKLTNFLQKL